MTHKEEALDYFSRHFHCSQSVLAAFSEECGLTKEQALKLGGCFGSGMRKGEVCGACTGALMVLGMLFGQSDETDYNSRTMSNKVNDEMMDRFAKLCGSYICNDLLGCDMTTEEGVQFARANNLFREFCPKMVANAVDILEEIIRENKPEIFEKSSAQNEKVSEQYEIVPATEADRAELLALYRAQLGREFCPWTEDYPSDETISVDLAKNALFVMKADGRIKAAISIEEDVDVDRLPCWDSSLRPEGELARIAVLPEEQGQGLGRIMMQYGMDELKRRGYKGIHIVVNKYNQKAIRCYAAFNFRTVGECHMYEQDFLCYEREL